MKLTVIMLLVSFTATLASLVFTVYFAFTGVQMNETFQIDSGITDISADRVLTKEQLAEIEREAINRYEEAKRQAKNENENSVFFAKVKERAQIFSWIPWLMLPFMIGVRDRRWTLILLSMPLLFALGGVLSVLELVTITVSLMFGVEVQRRLNTRVLVKLQE